MNFKHDKIIGIACIALLIVAFAVKIYQCSQTGDPVFRDYYRVKIVE